MANSGVDKNKQFFGIAEWYGQLFKSLDDSTRKHFAAQGSRKGAFPCPYLHQVPGLGPQTGSLDCKKPGGVCSIRNFHDPTGADDISFGPITATCPNRFLEQGLVLRHIAEQVLGCSQLHFAKEIPFLRRPRSPDAQQAILEDENDPIAAEDKKGLVDKEDVGKIDLVLVDSTDSENWCAVEFQAVYFSGKEMPADIKAISSYAGNGIPKPTGARRPDFRSSGPKRLMPQLMIKVPTLRRWGKKMVVVVDSLFFDALDSMTQADHISNCDIVWVVVGYDEELGAPLATLKVDRTVFATLEESIKALTAGTPTTLPAFEAKLWEKTRPF